MALTRIDDRGLKTPVDLLDSEKIRFGTGNDLEIYHDGSNSYIKDAGTGTLKILTNGLEVKNAADNAYSAFFGTSGAAELYFNGSKKLQTYANGTEVLGNLWLQSGGAYHSDNVKYHFGNSDDLQIYHSNDNNSYIHETGSGHLVLKADDLYIQNAAGSQTNIKSASGGAVELSHAGSKKFETTSTGAQITGNLRVDGLCDLYDDKRIRLGDSADFQLFHVGGENFIRGNASASPLYIDCCENLHIRHLDTDGSNSETMIKAVGDGAVELYHNNSKKISTASFGVQMEEDVQFPSNGDSNALTWDKSEHTLEFRDNVKAAWGDNDDLEIKHDGANTYFTNSTGQLVFNSDTIRLRKQDGLEDYIQCVANNQVDIYHNGSKKFETRSDGVQITGHSYQADDNKAFFGNAQDLQIYHNGSHSYIDNVTGVLHLRVNTSENALAAVPNAEVALYYNETKRFETTTGGAKITGNGMVTGDFLVDSDTGRLKCGLGEDLQIYHNGSHSFIENTYTSGDLYIRNNGPTDRDVFIQARAGENSIICKDDESVQLYYDGIQKFETRGYGARVYGHLGVGVDPGNTPNGRNNFIAIGDNDTGIAQNTDGQLEFWANNQEIMNLDTGEITCYKHTNPGTTNTYNLGSTSYRWANLYVNDAHFSNEGSSNSVDGTWGDWTLQEGEEDIFMLNNRTGKKYKMALTEVN